MWRALVVLCIPMLAVPADHSRAATPVVTQVTASSNAITSRVSADGVTLTIIAACSLSGSLCPFSAEILAAPALARTIKYVEYTYFPDRGRAPSANTNSAESFRFEGSQTTGELVYADVFLAESSAGALKKIALETTVPFAAPVRPALPDGLRFEDLYQMQYLEGTPTDYYHFRVWLRGEPEVLKRIKSVDYRLPEQFFSRSPIRGAAHSEYFLNGSASSRNKWDIVAVIRWTNGKVSTHMLPFRPK
jgi:hypothetical protein